MRPADRSPGRRRHNAPSAAVVVLAVAMLALPPASATAPDLRLHPPPLHPARAVLAPVGTAPEPTRAGLLATLRRPLAASVLGNHVGLAVYGLAGDRQILSVGARGGYTPASTTKLLTVAAALQLLGPQHRFRTSVVIEARRRRIILVGGGDPLLARRPQAQLSSLQDYPVRANLRVLARRTAVALRRRGISRVELGLDASLFVGPSASRHWARSYLSDDVVSRVSALAVDGGRVGAGQVQRSVHPAAAAAVSFARALSRDGITVRGRARPRAAPSRATVIAAVRSAPLAQIVEHVLQLSDDDAAEVLLRQVALAGGRPASFAGGVAAVRGVLRRLGIPLTGQSVYDGSGLSRQDHLGVGTLLGVLDAAADPGARRLRPLIAALPVAHFSGTLQPRFLAPVAAPGRGVVRAKTGTLTGVEALAGVVVDRDGAELAFVLIADHVGSSATLPARAAMDRVVAKLAGCGCR
jgi:serine-type D-Ala-D-Ala carboxypeptidase/endopeptidase (penicillin-binding protein 4)